MKKRQMSHFVSITFNQVVDFVVLTSGPNRVNNIIMPQSEHVHTSVNNIVVPGSPWAHAAIEGKNTKHTLKIIINTLHHHPSDCIFREPTPLLLNQSSLKTLIQFLMPPKLKKTSPRPKLNELINIIKQTKQQPTQIKSIDFVSKSEKKRRVNGLFDCLWVLSGGCELSFILNLLLKQRRTKTTLNNLTGLIQPKYDSIINTIQHAHQQAPNHNQIETVAVFGQ